MQSHTVSVMLDDRLIRLLLLPLWLHWRGNEERDVVSTERVSLAFSAAGHRLTVSEWCITARLLLHNTQTPKPKLSSHSHLKLCPILLNSFFPSSHPLTLSDPPPTVSRCDPLGATIPSEIHEPQWCLKQQFDCRLAVHSPANLLYERRRIPLNKLNSYQSPLRKQPPLLWGIGPAAGLHMLYWAFEQEPVVGLLSRYQYFNSWYQNYFIISEVTFIVFRPKCCVLDSCMSGFLFFSLILFLINVNNIPGSSRSLSCIYTTWLVAQIQYFATYCICVFRLFAFTSDTLPGCL